MNNPDETAELSVAEGVLLGHALVARVAAELGIRAFFIKGPVSVLQGLRQPRTSGDVDVFVAPIDLEAMVDRLSERGWRKRPVDPDSTAFARHSVTLDHPNWPCCLDVHHRFPGMERAADHCFEVMWAHTGMLELAGQKVHVPSEALGILVLALHALRTPYLPACQQELEVLAVRARSQSVEVGLVELSTATGSLGSVRPFLENLVSETSMPEWPEPSREWRNRSLTQEPGSARIVAIWQAPWRKKPQMLGRAVFPRPELFLARNIYVDMSWSGRLAQHRARWGRFLRAVPHIVSDLLFRG